MEEESSCCVPPGFRFHPTEEELVGYYLARKVAAQKIELDIIQEVDLYRIEPWDLRERCKQLGMTAGGEEWYFFSYKDRKYPSGTRTNRATAAGFWKATGRDKPVLSSRSSSSASGRVIGMRKTLVFYKGRAPNGRKTDWIMHEYRLQTNEHAPPQEEGWVVCRAFQKPVPNPRPGCYYDNGHHFTSGSSSSYYYSAAAGNILFPPQQQPYVVDDDLFESRSSRLFGISDAGYHTATGADQDEMIHQLQLQQGGQAIDWNFLDSLLQQSSSSSLPRADY